MNSIAEEAEVIAISIVFVFLELADLFEQPNFVDKAAPEHYFIVVLVPIALVNILVVQKRQKRLDIDLALKLRLAN